MESTYAKMIIGEYFGKHVDEVPIDYLVWAIPKYQYIEIYRRMYREMLQFILTTKIEVEERNGKYCFITKEFEKIGPDEYRIPFLITDWRGKDSKGNYVYEVGTTKYPLFIKQTGDKFEISNDYVSHVFKYGGKTLIYEKNENYYFIDNEDKVLMGAYLLRKPYIPQEIENKDFFTYKIKE